MRPKPWQGTGGNSRKFGAGRQRYGGEIGERFADVNAEEIPRHRHGTQARVSLER